MGAAAPKPPFAIPPHSLLWSFLAFSHEASPVLVVKNALCASKQGAPLTNGRFQGQQP
jgi:hypothetical protein